MASARRFVSRRAAQLLALSLLLGLLSLGWSVSPASAAPARGLRVPNARTAIDRFGARSIERHGARPAPAAPASPAASAIAGLAPSAGSTSPADASPSPAGDLAAFAVSVANGQAGVVRGVYVAGVLALPVVQQPAGAPYFVDMRPGYATQYGAAMLGGVTGLLADNLASGVLFYGLAPGQTVSIIYGDGAIRQYTITATLRYQALDPKNPYSNFVDLATGAQMSAGELFGLVYTGAGRLVLQTCLANDGIAAWGRLFVIATPAG